ncbi:MAG: FAD-dependent oxidoreductase [Nanoarchaeota archaeon]|nr:FAD-dependent oxidoreductase [Nanoarchaeota archaeon]
MAKDYDVIIIGGGVSGTALLYLLDKYTDIGSVALFEKEKKLAQIASHSTQNSQTLHFGDIETNYTFAKAKSVSAGARLVQTYLDTYDKKKHMHSIFPKMVLAVGTDEVNRLRERYKEFKSLFPQLELIERDEIERKEPLIVKGRDPDEEIVALWTPQGYTVDYEKLSQSFVSQTKDSTKRVDVFMDTQINHIKRNGRTYTLYSDKGSFKTEALVVDAGAMSIKFAKEAGYGEHLSILSVAGNFYRGPEVLKSKVYTMQNPKLPFAAVHGDPDVHATGYTRFGPTALPLLMLERRNWKTVVPYFQTARWNFSGFASLFKITGDPTNAKYIFKNILYELPLIGSRLFAKNVKKIIPTIKSGSIKKDRGYGGTRPQIVNTNTRTLSMGEARVEGQNAIFNITPSPGASTCLANALRDTQQVLKFLNRKYRFKTERFKFDFKVE